MRILLATGLALLAYVLPATAGAQAPPGPVVVADFEFHGTASLDPAFFAAGDILTSDPFTPGALTDTGGASSAGTYPGMPTRGIRVVPDGTALLVPADAAPTGDWTATALVRVADATPTTDVMSFGTGTTEVLAISDDKLVMRDGGTTTDIGGTIPDNQFVQITAVFESGDLTAYVDGAEAGEAADADVDTSTNALMLFGAGAADIARLRTFQPALSATEVAALSALDEDAPAAPSGGVFLGYEDGGDKYLGPISFQLGSIVDESTAPLDDLAIDIADAGGSIFNDPDPFSMSQVALGTESIPTLLAPDEPLPDFEDGEDYEVTVEGTDVHDQQATLVEPFTWDETAPTVSTDAPAVTTDRQPLLKGTASTGAGDDDYVLGIVCTQPAPCDPGNTFATFEADVVGGTWETRDLRNFCGCDPYGDLALGSYHVEVSQGDALWNVGYGDFDMKVVAPSDPPKTDDGGSTPPPGSTLTPTPTPTPTPIPPSTQPPANNRTRITGQQVARKLLDAALAAFRKETVRSFVKDGASLRFPSPIAGRARIDVFDSSRATKPIATGSSAFTRPGTQTISVRLTRAAKRKLRGKRSAQLRFKATFVPPGDWGATATGGRRLKR